MSIEENKATVRRVFDAFNQGDPAVIDEIYAPIFVHHDPAHPRVRSREACKRFGTGFFAAFPGQFTIEDLIAEGEKVVLRYTYRGTHQGQWRGLPPTGKAVTFTGTVIYRIVDGKAVEAWQNADNLSVLQQLGLIPAQG